MALPEFPANKTESRRAWWAALVMSVLVAIAVAAILLAPSAPHDKPGSDGDNPAAAAPTANGTMTRRTAPAIPQ